MIVYIVQYILSILYTTVLLMHKTVLKPFNKYLLIEDMNGCTRVDNEYSVKYVQFAVSPGLVE